MDVLAHALWAGAGLALARRRWPIAPRTVALTVALAVLPDLPQMLPIVGWSIVDAGSFAVLKDFATALPNQEPPLPASVLVVSHNLHCIMHSAIVAGVVSLLLWLRLRWLWIPLLGWWSHIVIDVFTHSADYYPVPVLYPFTMRGFDGVAWNTPWFMALNYVALGAAYLWLFRTRGRARAAAMSGPSPSEPEDRS